MARKRPNHMVEFDETGDPGDNDFYACADDQTDGSSEDYNYAPSQEDELNLVDSDDGNATLLYQKCMKKIRELDDLKKELATSVHYQRKKARCAAKKKDAFTRFSVSYFSEVIDSLDADKRQVIENYGFGCLLKFDKCFVPNKFAMWVASKIDHKSGDIVLKDKVISITEDSVNLILDLPTGGSPFPSELSAGKSYVLSRFGKASMPSAKFFGKLLIDKKELSNEDVIISFLLVALSCFLCPNSSVAPANRYLGVFENLQDMHKFDWSKFVHSWLLERIKSFNKGKLDSLDDPPGLGGCLYIIAVIYLDFVDFGSRQLPHALPRTVIWKGSLIKDYSDFDMITPGVYGARPLLDISKTCYSKQSIFLNKDCASLCSNSDFKSKLDEYSGCNLPEFLKLSICKLLDDHCINSSLSISMDITSLSNISSNLKKSFSMLLEHAYSVDSRTQKLVLSLLKMISEACPCDHNANKNNIQGNDQPRAQQPSDVNVLPLASDASDRHANDKVAQGSAKSASPFSYESPIGTQVQPSNRSNAKISQAMHDNISVPTKYQELGATTSNTKKMLLSILQ